jgi:hypothetical protein
MFYSRRLSIERAAEDLFFVRRMGHEDAFALRLGMWFAIFIPQPSDLKHARIDAGHIAALHRHQEHFFAEVMPC